MDKWVINKSGDAEKRYLGDEKLIAEYLYKSDVATVSKKVIDDYNDLVNDELKNLNLHKSNIKKAEIFNKLLKIVSPLSFLLGSLITILLYFTISKTLILDTVFDHETNLIFIIIGLVLNFVSLVCLFIKSKLKISSFHFDLLVSSALLLVIPILSSIGLLIYHVLSLIMLNKKSKTKKINAISLFLFSISITSLVILLLTFIITNKIIAFEGLYNDDNLPLLGKIMLLIFACGTSLSGTILANLYYQNTCKGVIDSITIIIFACGLSLSPIFVSLPIAILFFVLNSIYYQNVDADLNGYVYGITTLLSMLLIFVPTIPVYIPIILSIAEAIGFFVYQKSIGYEETKQTKSLPLIFASFALCLLIIIRKEDVLPNLVTMKNMVDNHYMLTQVYEETSKRVGTMLVTAGIIDFIILAFFELTIGTFKGKNYILPTMGVAGFAFAVMICNYAVAKIPSDLMAQMDNGPVFIFVLLGILTSLVPAVFYFISIFANAEDLDNHY